MQYRGLLICPVLAQSCGLVLLEIVLRAGRDTVGAIERQVNNRQIMIGAQSKDTTIEEALHSHCPWPMTPSSDWFELWFLDIEDCVSFLQRSNHVQVRAAFRSEHLKHPRHPVEVRSRRHEQHGPARIPHDRSGSGEFPDRFGRECHGRHGRKIGDARPWIEVCDVCLAESIHFLQVVISHASFEQSPKDPVRMIE
jgi:hypothetical protein